MIQSEKCKEKNNKFIFVSNEKECFKNNRKIILLITNYCYFFNKIS